MFIKPLPTYTSIENGLKRLAPLRVDQIIKNYYNFLKAESHFIWALDTMRKVIPVVLVLSCTVQLVAADVLTNRNRNKLFKSQTSILDNRAAKQYSNSIRLQPPQVITPTKWGGAVKFQGKYNGPFLKMAQGCRSSSQCAGGFISTSCPTGGLVGIQKQYLTKGRMAWLN